MIKSVTYKNLFLGFLIGILAASLFAFRGCQNKTTPLPATDTIQIRDTAWLPAPALVDSIRIEVPAKVDTAAILQQYFTKHVYRDTLIQAKFVEVHLTDTVYMNRILGRVVDYKLSFPTYNQEFSVSTVIGCKNLSLLAGYRHKKWELLGGYDFYNKSLLVGAKYTLFAWP